MTYWLNTNRPDKQFRTNGVTCWSRTVGKETWKYHDCPIPTWPSEWRYQVDEKELNREEQPS